MDGETSIGRRARPAVGQDFGPFAWQDLSGNTGYPDGVCSVTGSTQGNDTWVKALTTDGTVYQTRCDSEGQSLVCEEAWVEVTAQP
ncbi:hypothetical protein [Streptomyces apocyni]|uniref:hypothetical protein n=1 Tax=Streptomyces apocyni TaxID=2654677 RepID=UPI001E2ECA43|nr:hypothetical protein [Streptomyces apocyni]